MLPLTRPFQILAISKLAVPSISPLLHRSFAQPFSTSTTSRCASSSSEGDAAPATESADHANSSKKGSLKSGLYLVATPIGNLEDITLRALRILKSADVILSEDTRHSWKLLQHYNIDTPLLSYHKFNESQREMTTLSRLRDGQAVALISDAGTPVISDPGLELVKLCTRENIAVIPIPGPSALVTALSTCGLPTNEFTFVGFLPKHAGSRRSRLLNAANQAVTQIFFVPPHKLLQFLTETSLIFGESRSCVIAREMTKLHEEFWRGTLGEAVMVFSSGQPKGEITLLIEGKADSPSKAPSEDELEHELRDLISKGHSISTSVKIVAEGTSVKRKDVYALALRLFAKPDETEESSNG
ncbi:hypothetical protein KFK09_027275 [Dendrobium nobile]|uniref:Tetrapyrrole methylase domain-containing protein n=1 Tax=Dendrobium nobile TaxID=94219 RepID=A0A8T3AA54_DENNO|nr:hypothetical protein KFK09_027275 [Dendrobium nobile]